MLASPIGAQLRIIDSMISGLIVPSIESMRVAIYFSWTGVKSGRPMTRRASSGVHSTSTLIFKGTTPLERPPVGRHIGAMYARDQASIATPVGVVTIFAIDDAIEAIRIGDASVSRGTSEIVRQAVLQFEAWFAGERQEFDLPLIAPASPRGATLRDGLIAVGYGETMSYGELAQRLGSAPRAIGQLCARNPYPIIVPCHRILGSGGVLGAYSAGEGPKTKAWLLAHEQCYRPFQLSA